jgi:hypothetical protein
LSQCLIVTCAALSVHSTNVSISEIRQSPIALTLIANHQ